MAFRGLNEFRLRKFEVFAFNQGDPGFESRRAIKSSFRRAVRAAPFRADQLFQQANRGFQGRLPCQRPTGFRTLVRR
jgi:hypothetical protein